MQSQASIRSPNMYSVEKQLQLWLQKIWSQCNSQPTSQWEQKGPVLFTRLNYLAPSNQFSTPSDPKATQFPGPDLAHWFSSPAQPRLFSC